MTKLIPTISERIRPFDIDSFKKTNSNTSLLKKKTQQEFDIKSWISRSFKEFASNTALHGYNHIVRDDTAAWERYDYFVYLCLFV